MHALASRIIDALGGTTDTARMISAPISTVHSWRKIGIPAARLDHLKLAAQRDGKMIDWESGAKIEADHDAASTAPEEAASARNAAVFTPDPRDQQERSAA